jgi:hypothetical protein
MPRGPWLAVQDFDSVAEKAQQLRVPRRFVIEFLDDILIELVGNRVGRLVQGRGNEVGTPEKRPNWGQ